ncbi:hypothetical protein ACET3Z_014381 [Daucus carota]
MGTTGLVLYLLLAFSVAVVSVFFIPIPESHLLALHGSQIKVWPDLEVNWRVAVATVIGFLGSGFGTVGGVGGGGIFVPMLNLIVGFDTKSAAALSKCMIMGASGASVWYNLRVQHPCREVAIIDYDLALLFQPMLMLGITLGVSLSVVFPYWLITILIIVLFLGTSSRSFFKAIKLWKEESLLKKEMTKQQGMIISRVELLVDTVYEPLVEKEEKTALQIIVSNLKWKRILALLVLWASFLFLQIIKNGLVVCSTWYWVLNLLQLPFAFGVFGYECCKLHKECLERKNAGNLESVCEASIEWSAPNLAFCALCGILGGTVGGLLGSGGGFILGPLLLEIGVIPEVASATATFVMMFSSSLSVVEFYLLDRFPIPYAMYLMFVSVLAGFWGQFFVRKLIAILGRASVIVFILSAVIFASALTMGVNGIEKSIKMIHGHEFMGFLPFCTSQ